MRLVRILRGRTTWLFAAADHGRSVAQVFALGHILDLYPMRSTALERTRLVQGEQFPEFLPASMAERAIEMRILVPCEVCPSDVTRPKE